jgi:hypothetical protein
MVAGVLAAATFAHHPDSAIATIPAAIYFGNACLIKYKNHYLDTWFVFQTPIELGSLEIAIIKSTDSILKVIISVFCIPSFRWYLWLILHVVVHVVSFSTLACAGNQLQPLYTICITSEHATHCNFSNAMTCPSAVLIAFRN